MLEGINNISDATPSLLIKEGLAGYFDWGMLSIGGLVNVENERIRPQNNPNYSNGQVWQCKNKNLVWESGVGALVSSDNSYPGVSGIYIGGNYYPRSTTGTYSYNLDHVNGRVIFNNPVSTSLNITMNYSHKYCDVTPIDDFDHFVQVFDEKTGHTISSGDYNLDSRATVTTPVIGIESVPRRSFRPYQLGGGQYLDTDVLFHCIANTSEEVDKLVDIVSMQNDKSIFIFDLDKIYSSGVYPLDYNGVPNSGALRYPDLLDGYRHSKTLRLHDAKMDGSTRLSSKIRHKIVRISTELILNIV
jgi:hypothetical protein